MPNRVRQSIRAFAVASGLGFSGVALVPAIGKFIGGSTLLVVAVLLAAVLVVIVLLLAVVALVAMFSAKEDSRSDAALAVLDRILRWKP